MSAEQTISGVDAGVIADVVETIAGRDGVCHPRALVDKARPKRSPLHPLFTWNDSAAAEQWRLVEARRTIRTIRVIRSDDETVPSGPRFVHVSRVTEAGVADGYVPTVVALRGPDRSGVLRDALGALGGLQSRYQALAELAGVWEAVEQVKVDALKEAA